jgi:hypothetical protein
MISPQQPPELTNPCQYPIRPLYDSLAHLGTAILGRSALFIIGLFWVPVDQITKKRYALYEVNLHLEIT